MISRVLVYSADKLTADTLTNLLKTLPDMAEVACCTSAKDLLRCAKQYDIVVIDEDTNAFHKIKSCPCLLLTEKDITGADIIRKPFKFEDFANILCLALLKLDKNKIVRLKQLEFFPEQRLLQSADEKQKVILTEKETQILLCLWRAAPVAVDKAKLLQEVWGYTPDITTHTLQTHIYRLRQKTEQNLGLDLIEFADGGYILTV